MFILKNNKPLQFTKGQILEGEGGGGAQKAHPCED